jgi:hypothetical protein
MNTKNERGKKMTNTCKNQMCLNGDCRTCPNRPISNLEIENKHAAEALNKAFSGLLVVVAIGLIILTTIYL